MDPEFAKVVASWHDFYNLAGSAAASLVGLLFVAVSMHLGRITAADSGHLLSFATHTFSSFLYVLLISLFFTIPDQSADKLGWELATVGAVITLRHIRHLSELKASATALGDGANFFRTIMPVLCYASISLVGWRLAAGGSPRILSAMISIVMLLLLTATRNAWRLLIELGRGPSSAEPGAG